MVIMISTSPIPTPDSSFFLEQDEDGENTALEMGRSATELQLNERETPNQPSTPESSITSGGDMRSHAELLPICPPFGTSVTHPLRSEDEKERETKPKAIGPTTESTKIQIETAPLKLSANEEMRKQQVANKCTKMHKRPLKTNNRSRIFFNPTGRVLHLWNGIISTVVVYHLWVIIYRYAFAEINRENMHIWIPLDYFADFLFVVDMIISVRTGFMEDGVMQFDGKRMRIHYVNSTQFYVDCLSLLPLDFLYLSVGFNSTLRIFRLCKMYKFWQFLDRAERHASHPNIIRLAKLVFYYLTILHWNACAFKIVHQWIVDSDGPEWNKTQSSLRYHKIFTTRADEQRDNGDEINLTTTLQIEEGYANCTVYPYLQAVYWGLLGLISIGGLPTPDRPALYVFTICQGLMGLLLFAAVLGYVSSIIMHISAGQKEFQARLDKVKNYLSLRCVPSHLQGKVINWFDYLWYTNKITDEDDVLSSLPHRLRVEIALQMHLNTLKRVDIFQNAEEGFLSELVLRLRMVLFAPGDFVCRKGEIGKQMYIVNRGTLHVLADDNRTVLATLRAGSYFGELSILNLGQNGNRRTASVRSLGYSDLFRLSKSDLWDVLKDYPGSRRVLESHAYKRLGDFNISTVTHMSEKPVHQANSVKFTLTNEMSDQTSTLCDMNEGFDRHLQTVQFKPNPGELCPVHSSADGSDGYGSEPSRCSAYICTPYQSPTPPISQHSECTTVLPVTGTEPINLRGVCEEHLTAVGVIRNCQKVPLFNYPEEDESMTYSHADHHSQVHRGITLNQVNEGLPTYQLKHHLCRNPVRACAEATAINRNPLTRTRNFSMPTNLIHSGLGKTGHQHRVVDTGWCQVRRTVGHKSRLSNEHTNQLRESPRFGLYDDDEDEYRSNSRLNSEASGGFVFEEAEEFSQKKITAPVFGTVPLICFEEASSSPSSSSSNVNEEKKIFFPPPPPCVSAQTHLKRIDSSPENQTLLSVPRLRMSSSTSSHIPWPSSRVPASVSQDSCKHTKCYPGRMKHGNPAVHVSGVSVEEYPLLEELGRLQRRVMKLESESVHLNSREHLKHASSSNSSKSGYAKAFDDETLTDHSPDSVECSHDLKTKQRPLKRSTSLQVPGPNKSRAQKGPKLIMKADAVV